MIISLEEQFKPEFYERIDGIQHVKNALSAMELKLGKKLPATFPISLELITMITVGGNELILPEEPSQEASYFLVFDPSHSHRLQESQLFRITDRPQTFEGVLDHPHVGDIIADLRKAYDGRSRNFKRGLVRLPIPRAERAHGESLPKYEKMGEECSIRTVLLEGGLDAAKEFDYIFKKHGALEQLNDVGFKKLIERIGSEISAYRTCSYI